MSFKAFLESEEFVRFITENFANQPVNKWSAGKDEVLDTWTQIRPDTPIFMQPLQDVDTKAIEKSSYGEDGIRITGSWSFIASVLSRLKDLLQFENEETKLRLVFKGVGAPNPNGQQSFAFYINRENRKKRKQAPQGGVALGNAPL